MNQIFSDLYVISNNNMENNAYVLIKNHHCVIVDPSNYGLSLTQFINQKKLVVDGIILTHGHYDHLADAGMLGGMFNTKVYCYFKDQVVVRKYNYAQEIFGKDITIDDSRYVYYQELALKVGAFKFEVVPTPGHTIGSVCLKYGKYWFTGDTLFIVDIGRSDMATGNMQQILSSIEKLTHIIKDDEYILCGHGTKYLPFSDVKKVNIYVQHFLN